MPCGPCAAMIESSSNCRGATSALLGLCPAIVCHVRSKLVKTRWPVCCDETVSSLCSASCSVTCLERMSDLISISGCCSSLVHTAVTTLALDVAEDATSA